MDEFQEPVILSCKNGTIEELTAENKLKEYGQKKVDALDLFLEKDPNNIEILLKKAFYFLDDHVDGKALEIYKQILEIDPSCVDAYVWWAELLIAEWADAEEAEPILKKALELDPNRADIHHLLSWAYSYMDEEKELYHLKKSIELEPTWLCDRICLIRRLIRNGQYTSAKKELDEAYAQLDENFPVPEDDMQHYYEVLFTGRLKSKHDLDEYNQELSEKITT